MDIQSLLPYVGTSKIKNILEVVYGIHKQSLDNKSLNSSFQVNLTFTSGLNAQGYIIGLDTGSRMLTLANFSNNNQSYYVQYLELDGIQSVGIEHFEKNIEKFCNNQIPEGIGEPPTVLALKREFQEIKKTLQNTFYSNLEVNINWAEIDKDTPRTIWAIDGILKQLLQFKNLIENDTYLIEAFNESIRLITIIDSEANKMSIDQGIFTISFIFSNGLINVKKAEAIKEFLSENL